MTEPTVSVGSLRIANSAPFVLLGGVNVLESRDFALRVAEHYVQVCERLGIGYVFKASYDKANRTSIRSFRGPGLAEGLRILGRIKADFGLPILTDIHEPAHAAAAADVADILQIPAFLSRQTDLLAAAAATGRIVNIKKGQFLAPLDVRHAIDKVRESGNDRILITERGFSFGYNNLVVDMRGFPIMARNGYPVILDATHSVQLPGGGGGKSSGQREFVPTLSFAALAAGADGLFLETHPDPDNALSDGPNMVPLDQLEALLAKCLAFWRLARA